MTLIHILVFVVFAVLVRWLCPRQWRGWCLLSGSLLAIFWLQPSTPIRNLDFWIPASSISLTILIWAITRHPQPHNRREGIFGLIVIVGSLLAVGVTRHIPTLCCITPSRPPNLIQVSIALALFSIFFLFISRLSPGQKWLPGLAIAFLLVLFLILKSEILARLASAGLRYIQGQSIDLASSIDLPWLGFSYLAFRLIHVLRDFQSGKLPPTSLDEFTTYALFFPAITAGPIDRMQHFLQEYRKILKDGKSTLPAIAQETRARTRPGDLITPNAIQDTIQGGERILFGVFKKFVLADSLALLALNSQNALQSSSIMWTWIMLYAFGLRIYFDFAGYTDIAIGVGRLVGIKLPENFDRPYLKPNLTAFWNSWHITLAQWFRAYFFNPVTRSLRYRYQKLPVWSVILAGQFITMVLIGLWHGLTWNYFAWGAWHGIGLFFHNRWSGWARPVAAAFESHPRWKSLSGFLGGILTFHFVLLGWVWFALPTLETASSVFLRLFGW